MAAPTHTFGNVRPHAVRPAHKLSTHRSSREVVPIANETPAGVGELLGELTEAPIIKGGSHALDFLMYDRPGANHPLNATRTGQ